MKIILYSQEGCPMCKAVELQLKKTNIEYTINKNIEEMKKLEISHTPVLSVDGELLAGKDILTWIKTR